MSDFASEWHGWLALDEKWLPRLTASLCKIEIDGRLQKMSWEEQVSHLVPGWIEKAPSSTKKATKLYGEKGTGRDVKGHKLESLINTEYQRYENCERASIHEKGYKSDEENRPGPNEKATKFNKKMRYLITILLALGSPLSIEELMDLFEYTHKGTFRDNYIKPLEAAGFISKTNPDKPTASNQKYVITEKGKRFLTGQDF